jgi:hypothetical protein
MKYGYFVRFAVMSMMQETRVANAKTPVKTNKTPIKMDKTRIGCDQPKKRKSHPEDDLQLNCVKWFRLQYPQHYHRFFHVPNGGSRSKVEAARFKGLGVLAGVSDLFLLVPVGSWCGMIMELKSEKGKLTESQSDFLAAINAHYYTVVIKSFEQFVHEVNFYLNTKKVP